MSGQRMVLAPHHANPRRDLPSQEPERRAAAGRDEPQPLRQVLLLEGGHQVAATDDGLRVAAGQALRQRIGAVVEGRDFVDAERAVPDDCRRAVAGLQESLDGHRSDIENFHLGGDGIDRHGFHEDAGPGLGSHDGVERQDERRARAEQRSRHLQLVALPRRAAHPQALRLQEGAGHRAPDAEAIDAPQQAAQDPDLRRNLRAAHDRHQRMRGIGHDPAQGDDLALHQESGDGRQVLCDPHRRGVGSVRGAERIVDIKLAEGGQLPGKGRVVFGFAGIEADILQHHNLAVAHRPHSGLDRGTDAVLQVAHRPSHELAEPLRQRRGPVGVVDLAVGAAEMRDQDHARTALDQVLDRRERLADAGIVDDAAILDRDVEVDADQHALARDVEVANRGFLERAAQADVGSQFSRSPMNTARSTTRQEYPHSLSYQENTLPCRSPMTMVSGASTMDELELPLKSLETSSSSVTARMPLRSLAAASRKASLMVSADTGSRVMTARATRDTFGVGTRSAIPWNLPFSSGMTSAIALAAPVVVGITESAAARARRKSLWGASSNR